MKRRRQVVLFFCVLFVVGMMVPCMGSTEEAGKAKGGAASEKGYDDWHFLFYLPGWVPGLKGDVAGRGVKADLDISVGQSFENLKYIQSNK